MCGPFSQNVNVSLTCLREPHISLHSGPGKSSLNIDPAIERLYLKRVGGEFLGMFDFATTSISGVLRFNYF